MNNFYSQAEFSRILAENNIVVTGEIFVYKSGFIGEAYIDKEALNLLGSDEFISCLNGMANQAISSFLSFDDEVKNVLVIGPANGAISYAPIVSSYLQKYFRTIKFRHGRTQLDKNDKHYIAEKHKALIDISDTFIIVEDIVNQGTTIKEVSAILPKQVNSVLCLVDRGNNSAENLGIEQFFPFLRVNMDQYDPRKNASLFESEMKINTTLGKGNIWVEQFGQPPYGDDVDFSTFSLLK